MSNSTVCDVAVRIGENTQVDLQLPAQKPVGAVLVNAQRYLQTYLDEAGCPDPLPGPATGWRLRTPIGTLLDNDLSLAAQHVLNGDPLELIAAPKGEQFKPRIENVSVAVARTTERLFATATRTSLQRTLGVMCAVMLAAAMGFLLVLAYTHHSWMHTGFALAPVAMVGLVAVVNARRVRSRLTADLCALGLLLFAPPALALLVPSPWNGAGPRLLVGAATVTTLALAGMSGQRYITAYTALATAAVFTTVAEIPAITSAVPGQRMLVVLIWLLIIMLSRADLTSVRRARLPIPAFPSGSNRYLGRAAGPVGSNALVPVTAPPDPAVLLERTVRANHFLTGLLIGLGIVATALTALLVNSAPGSWQWIGLAAAIPFVFAFRTFHFAGWANITALLCGTFGSALALAGTLARHHNLWWGVAVAVATAVLAAAAPLTIPSGTREQSPLNRFLRPPLENLLCLSVLLVPLILLRVPQMVYYWSFD